MLRAVRPKRPMLLLALILVCAAVVRIDWPGFAEFKYDEAMISRRAIAFAQQGIWPASTISSIPGIPQPPIKALLLAIPYAFTRDPMAAVVFQGLLGTITVGLAYLFGAKYFDRRAGLIAAGLLALAPWALFYDRKLWSQDVPVITSLMMLGLFLFVVDRRRWGVILSSAALGALIGFYLGDAILAAVVGFGLICFPRILVTPGEGERRWQPFAWLAAALIVLVITLSPYAVELGRRHADPSAVSSAVTENTPRPFDPLGQLLMSAQVATGYDYHALAGDHAAQFDASLPLSNPSQPLDGLALVMTVVAMLYIASRAILEALRARQGPAPDGDYIHRVAPYVLLAVWLFVPVLAWTAFRQMPYPHRYIMAYPSQSLALGIMLSDGWRWLSGRWPRWKLAPAAIIPAGIAILGLWHAIQFFSMMRLVDTTPITGGHGAPVERIWAAASQARALSGPHKLPIVIHTSGDDPEYQGGAAEFDALLGDLPIVLVRTPGLEVLPSQDFVWLRDKGAGQYLVEKRSGSHASDSAGLARLSNGVDLVSAVPVAPVSGSSQTILLTWRVRHPADLGKDYGFTAQLYAADGANVGQVDTPFLRSPYWRTGDTITTQVDIPIKSGPTSAGPLNLVVAMYAYLSETQIQPVDILDVAGNPAGQQVTIPLK